MEELDRGYASWAPPLISLSPHIMAELGASMQEATGSPLIPVFRSFGGPLDKLHQEHKRRRYGVSIAGNRGYDVRRRATEIRGAYRNGRRHVTSPYSAKYTTREEGTLYLKTTGPSRYSFRCSMHPGPGSRRGVMLHALRFVSDPGQSVRQSAGSPAPHCYAGLGRS